MKIAALILAFLLWGLQIFGLCSYTFVLLNQDFTSPPNSDYPSTFFNTLLLVSLGIVLWTFAVRWLFKSFLVRANRVRSPAAIWSLYALTGLLIWIPSGAVSIYGMILSFATQDLMPFFLFTAISITLLIIHFPLFLIPAQLPPGAEQGAAANP